VTRVEINPKFTDNNDIVDPASGASAGGTSVSGGGETASADGSGGASGGGGAGSAALRWSYWKPSNWPRP